MQILPGNALEFSKTKISLLLKMSYLYSLFAENRIVGHNMKNVQSMHKIKKHCAFMKNKQVQFIINIISLLFIQSIKTKRTNLYHCLSITINGLIHCKTDSEHINLYWSKEKFKDIQNKIRNIHYINCNWKLINQFRNYLTSANDK